MNRDFKVGITNFGEPGEDFSWVNHLNAVKFAVVVSKSANREFEDILLDNRDKIIYHAVCTGLNGTILEKDVPSVKEKFEHLNRLANFGFPISQMVLRIDPLFPAQWIKMIDKTMEIDYIQKLSSILQMAEQIGIRRVRYSYLNVYDFVLADLWKISHDFTIQPGWKPLYSQEIQLDKINGNFEFEACAEYFVPPHHQVPCISDKDLKALKIDLTHALTFKGISKASDPACRCPMNKLELFTRGDFKCAYDCIYCYWKSMKKTNIAK